MKTNHSFFTKILWVALVCPLLAYGCNAENSATDSEDSNMNDSSVMRGKDTARTGDTLNSNSYVDTTHNTPANTPQNSQQ